MNAADPLALGVLDWLWRTTWQVAVLAALILAALKLGGRFLTPHARYALWLLVVGRLLMPALPEAPWSIFHLAPAPAAHAPLGPRAAAPPLDPTAEIARADEATRPEGGREPKVPPSKVPKPAVGTESAVLASIAAPTPEPGPAAPGSPSRNGASWALLLWLSVAAVLALRILLLEFRFARALRGARAVEDPAVLDALASSARSLGVKRPPRILATDAVRAPALVGLLRPRLLLPPHLEGRFSAEELACVFRHELAHLRARDGPLNALLALLECVHWFNPAVWFSTRRIRAERESARDWTALQPPGSELQRVYGRTLIKLIECCSAGGRRSALLPILEGHREMKRRISMIANHESGSRRGRVSAFALGGGIVLVAFTGAQPLSPPDGSGSGAAQDSAAVQPIHVERRGSAPSWEEDLRRKLATRVTLRFARTPFRAVLDGLRAEGKVDLVVHPDTLAERAEEALDLEATEVTLERALDRFCEATELEWGLVQGAVFIAPSGAVPSRYEQRVYDIRPLVSGGDDDRPDRLVDLIRSVVVPELWERESVEVAHWKGLLLVNQTESVHRELARFLTQLRNRGRGGEPDPSPTSAALEEALRREVSVHFDSAPLKGVCAWLRSEGRLPLLVDQDADPDFPITLHLERVPLSRAVEWVATLSKLTLSVREDAVALGPRPSMEIRFYDVEDLLKADVDEDPDEAAEALDNLLRSSVAPATWQSFSNARIGHWDRLMIVNQSPAVQTEIERFLGTLRRAFRG
jgi:beta-lactamase regulating signal transducer with metallopeptidase domain